MIISLALIVYTIITAFISGLVLYKCFLGLFKTGEGYIHSSFIAFAGLCWMALLLQVQHIFLPINAFSHLLIWSINGSVWLSHKTFFSERINQLKKDFFSSHERVFIFILVLLAAIIGVAAKPGIGDIADYHLQAIKWIESYKVVPGIGNLRRQLGNNSNWFLLNAFFGCSFLKLNSVYVLNASILILAVIYFIPQRGEKLWLFKAIILLYLVATAFRKYVGAVTNDYAITLFTLVVFTQWIQSVFQQQSTKTSWMIVFMIFMMITFKISALPMVLMVIGMLYILWKHQQLSVKSIGILAGFGIAVFIPWIYTNVMNSGYLCFPISSPDLFPVDWKMRKSILEWEVMYNLLNGRNPGIDTVISGSWSFSVWFPLWIKSTDLFSLALMIAFICYSGLIGILLLIKSTRIKIAKEIHATHVWIVLLTIYGGLYLWFTHGPTPRFVFGYLVFSIAFYSVLFSSAFDRVAKMIEVCQSKFTYVITAVLLLTGIVFIKDHFTTKQLPQALLIPINYPAVHYSDINIDGHIIHVPYTNEQCWDLSLPCTSILDPQLKMRGASLEDGFSIKQ